MSAMPASLRVRLDALLPLLVQLLIQTIDKDRYPVEPEPLALVVKVKVGVVNARVAHRLNGTFVGLLHGLLVTLLVDEVDEVLVSVDGDLLIKVTLERFGLRNESRVSMRLAVVDKHRRAPCWTSP